MNRVATNGRIIDIAAERFLHDLKGNVVPWNVLRREEMHVETLLSCLELRREHSSAKDHIHLADVGKTQHRRKSREFYTRVGFFPCLTNRSLLGAFADFHEAGWKRPKAVFWLDRATTEQDLIAPFWNTAGDNLRILIMDGLTDLADESGKVIARRDFF